VLLKKYGEEPHARRIARYIINARPVRTTTQLARIVETAAGGRKGRIHPATRTFQALRIAVNKEMERLENALAQALGVLGCGGRLVVISYHSLEDRIVKQFIQHESRDCICPPGTPVCICGHSARLRPVSRKIVIPSQEESRTKPRSRSARLRAAERINIFTDGSMPKYSPGLLFSTCSAVREKSYVFEKITVAFSASLN